MHKLTLWLFILSSIFVGEVHRTLGQVYFTNKNFMLHSRKNISAFYQNEKHLDRLIKSIKGSREYFIGKASNSTQKPVLKTMCTWLEQRATLCIDSLGFKMAKAREMVDNSLPMEVDQKKYRYKRGFKPLGELVSFLTDMPSPSAWEDEQTLVIELKNVIRGSLNETHMLEHTVNDEAETINEVINEVSKLVHIQFKTSTELSNFQFYLNSLHRVDQICYTGEKVAERLVEEARIIEEIREKSRTNSPSEFLFPISQIFLKTKFLNTKRNTPFFNSEHDIELLYSMSSAVTTIESKTIYSVLNLPLVDYSQKYDFIQPTLNVEEVDVINKISNLALAPIDTFLCAKSQHNIKLLSSRNLQRCQHTPNMQTYICKGRMINHVNHNFGCKELPSSIALELTPNKIIIKTEKGTNIKISCPNLNKNVQISSVFSILNLKSDCKIISKEFYINAHSKNISDSYLSQPFEVFGYDLETPTLTGFKKLNNQSLKMQNMTEKLKTDLKINSDLDLKNEISLKALEKKFLEKKLNWTLIATLSIIGILTIVLATIYLYKKCKNRTNSNSNINISMTHDSDKKEDKAKVNMHDTNLVNESKIIKE